MPSPIEQVRADYHAALISDGLQALDSTGDTIPLPLREGLRLYLAERIETGGFLRRVLENDFRGAISRAHPGLTLAVLKHISGTVYTYFPAKCHGSPEAVRAWLAGAGGATDA